MLTKLPRIKIKPPQFLLSNLFLVSVFLLLLNTVIGPWLESSMLPHVLIELPSLVLVGIYLARQPSLVNNKNLRFVLRWCNQGGIFGLIIMTFVLVFWMLPRWLDASINQISLANAKYISMILAGLFLGLSWPKTHILTRAVIKIEFLTMLFRLGWIYTISPERLCNNYLLSEQVWLGKGLIICGLALSFYWIIGVFTYTQDTCDIGDMGKHSY